MIGKKKIFGLNYLERKDIRIIGGMVIRKKGVDGRTRTVTVEGHRQGCDDECEGTQD